MTETNAVRAVCVSVLLLLALLYPGDALHSAVFAVVTCLCVCVSVRHTLLLCINGLTYLKPVLTVW